MGDFQMKGLDIRFLIGLLFTILGAVLVAFGIVSDPSLYTRSLGININLWWGLALAGAGAVTLLLSRKGLPDHKTENAPVGPTSQSHPSDDRHSTLNLHRLLSIKNRRHHVS